MFDNTRTDQVVYAKTEQSIGEAANHHFVVSLHYACRRPKKQYLVDVYGANCEMCIMSNHAVLFLEGRYIVYLEALRLFL